MTTRLPSLTQVTALDAHERLTTRSLRDDEIRAIADATYRSDNPLRYEGVRQAALLFERLGYTITRDPQVSPLTGPPQPITIDALTIDPLRRMVHLDGREMELKPREFDLLYLLGRHHDQVFSRAHLLDLVWPRDYAGDERTVDVHMSRIRRKLGGSPRGRKLLVTVPAVGYTLRAPRSSAA